MELLQRFAQCLDKHKAIFIHIFGDSMLDEDYQVKVSRISPECANVHVLLSEDDNPFRRFPGGAANVCYQLSNFNIISRLFTFIDDEAYKVIRNHGVKYWGHSPNLPKGYYTPRKKRFYERSCQVVARWDIEKHRYGLDDPTFRHIQAELAKQW